MSKFDSKSFNPQAFGKYVEKVPNLKRNELLKSRALTPNAEIRALFNSQTSTAYGIIPMFGNLGGEALNYDGQTDITSTSTATFERGVVVFGRAKAWTEKDFSEDITGGVKFMSNVGNQVAGYWEEVDQEVLLSMIKGIYASTDPGSAVFATNHTYEIATAVGASTLNSAIQKACGQNKDKFQIVLMHSVVATNLENLGLLEYMKYTDANGIQRSLNIATWNGRTVLVDDSMPVREVPAVDAVSAVTGVPGVYTLAVTTKAIAGDALTLDEKTYVCGTTDGWDAGDNVTADATALKALLAVDFPQYTIGGTGGSITLTQKVALSENVPTLIVNKNDTAGTLVATITETTEGVTAVAAVAAAAAYTEYTTYTMGLGAFDYEDIGAKVAYEMDRDPKVNGGEDTLYSRQRKCLAPYGFSYKKAVQATLSPTNTEFENGANWELVNDGAGTYFDHKAIPIARILSRG